MNKTVVWLSTPREQSICRVTEGAAQGTKACSHSALCGLLHHGLGHLCLERCCLGENTHSKSLHNDPEGQRESLSFESRVSWTGQPQKRVSWELPRLVWKPIHLCTSGHTADTDEWKLTLATFIALIH